MLRSLKRFNEWKERSEPERNVFLFLSKGRRREWNGEVEPQGEGASEANRMRALSYTSYIQAYDRL